MAQRNLKQNTPETTESYRGEIRNAERVLTPSNDNRPTESGSASSIQVARKPPSTASNPPTRTSASKTAKAPVKIAAKIARLSSSASAVMAIVVIPYALQFCFAIICLVGYATMAVDDGIFGIFNGFGEALFAVGMIGALICGVAIAAVAEVPLKAAGANPMRTDCWFVLIVCAWLHLIPVVNLFPVMAIWCLYVALAT